MWPSNDDFEISVESNPSCDGGCQLSNTPGNLTNPPAITNALRIIMQRNEFDSLQTHYFESDIYQRFPDAIGIEVTQVIRSLVVVGVVRDSKTKQTVFEI